MTRFFGSFKHTLEREGARSHWQDEKLRLLRAAPLFHGLTDEEMERVGQMTTMSQSVRGQTIYSPGETREALFLLKRGRMQIYRLSGWREAHPQHRRARHRLRRYGAHRTAQARRLCGGGEDSMVCVMSQHDVETFISPVPVVGVHLAQLLSARVRELEDRLEESIAA